MNYAVIWQVSRNNDTEQQVKGSTHYQSKTVTPEGGERVNRDHFPNNVPGTLPIKTFQFDRTITLMLVTCSDSLNKLLL